MPNELCGTACFTERERGWRYGPRWRRQRYRIWHDVMTPRMIRQLPARHALVVRGSCAPVIARLEAAWNDRRYKLYRGRGLAVANLPPARPDVPDPPPGPPRLTLHHRPAPDLPLVAAQSCR